MFYMRQGVNGIRIVLQQLDIGACWPPRRPNVERTFADLLDGGDTRQRQEETEMIGKLCIFAGDRRIVAGDVLGLERLAIDGEDEFGLGRDCFRAVAQCCQSRVNLTCRTGRQMNIVALENAACNIRGIRATSRAKPLYGGILVPESC